MENINNEILNQLSQIRVDINFIKNNMNDGELTEWAEKELEDARMIPDSEMVSLEEIENNILSK